MPPPHFPRGSAPLSFQSSRGNRRASLRECRSDARWRSTKAGENDSGRRLPFLSWASLSLSGVCFPLDFDCEVHGLEVHLCLANLDLQTSLAPSCATDSRCASHGSRVTRSRTRHMMCSCLPIIMSMPIRARAHVRKGACGSHISSRALPQFREHEILT